MQLHQPADNPVTNTYALILAESIAVTDGQSTQLTAMQHIITFNLRRGGLFIASQDLQSCRGVMIELALRSSSQLSAINR